MKLVSVKYLVTAATLFVAPAAMSQAYGRANIINYGLVTANVVVTYSGCRTDRFVVSQGRKTDKGIVPGVNEAPTRRGACLINNISATFNGDSSAIRPYMAAGTAKSQFVLLPTDVRNIYYIDSKDHYESDHKKRYKDDPWRWFLRPGS